MENSITRNVSDLVASDKRSLEHLLGGQLEAAQKVYVMVFTPNMMPEPASRAQAAARIEETLDKAAAHARSHDATDDAIDQAVDAAMDEVRRRPSS